MIVLSNFQIFLQFYPFGFVHNDTTLFISSGAITMDGNFSFYHHVASTVYVCYVHVVNLYMCTDVSSLQINDNGIISFGRIYNERTPQPLPLQARYERSLGIIAPYWADVDITGTGTIYYRQTTDPSLLARATNEIRAAFPNSPNVTIRNLLIATWDNVGYYDQRIDKVLYCVYE